MSPLFAFGEVMSFRQGLLPEAVQVIFPHLEYLMVSIT